jgi:hypothetical protein
MWNRDWKNGRIEIFIKMSNSKICINVWLTSCHIDICRQNYIDKVNGEKLCNVFIRVDVHCIGGVGWIT